MNTFAEIYDSLKDSLEFQVEELSLAFTESVLLRMEELGDMSGAQLAERMESSKPYVSKLLKGKSNFTLETLVKLARALECRVEAPKLIPLESKTQSAQVVRFIRRHVVTEFTPGGLVKPRLDNYADNTPAAA